MQIGNRNGGGSRQGAPQHIADLAEGCVRYVERAVGVKLDYEPETLPLLDHYLTKARLEARVKPEILMVVAQTAGAYLGEVVRRRHASWWRTEGRDPPEWQVEFEDVYLAFSPVRFVAEALLREDPKVSEEGAEQDETGDEGARDIAPLELEEEDHDAVAARLAELPPVSEDEFYAPSTRVEVIDIAVEAIRARRIAAGEQVEMKLRPEDYDDHG